MQSELFLEYEDYSEMNVMVGLSGGINSAAVACWLAKWPEQYKPKVLHLYYAHFAEHSPDTFRFVKDLIKYCRLNFKDVRVKITRNSVLNFFEEQKMIPHPQVAPCTRLLKVIPMHEYIRLNGVELDMVGYVREETRRIRNMAKKSKKVIKNNSIVMDDVTKHFPISDKKDSWCFGIVESCIGWYPKIYTLKFNDAEFVTFLKANIHRLSTDSQKVLAKKIGRNKRVFAHNNCMPCKNMQEWEYLCVEYYYNDLYLGSIRLSERLKAHWGRLLSDKGDNALDTLQFNLDFGRTLEETNYQQQTCGVCAFD